LSCQLTAIACLVLQVAENIDGNIEESETCIVSLDGGEGDTTDYPINLDVQ
jgi:hypothetical protein